MAPQHTEGPSVSSAEPNLKAGNQSSSVIKEEKNNSTFWEALYTLFFWGEKYNDNIEAVWNKLPPWVSSFVVSVAVFLLGITAQGM